MASRPLMAARSRLRPRGHTLSIQTPTAGLLPGHSSEGGAYQHVRARVPFAERGELRVIPPMCAHERGTRIGAACSSVCYGQFVCVQRLRELCTSGTYLRVYPHHASSTDSPMLVQSATVALLHVVCSGRGMMLLCYMLASREEYAYLIANA